MRTAVFSIRHRLDRIGIAVSGLCAVHCLLGLVLVSLLGLGGEALLDPSIHRIGLAIAIAIGTLTLGLGALRHGRIGPLVTGACGLALMSVGLAVSHGPLEAGLTIAGVLLVAAAHIANLRRAA